ncbi:MAG: hypothetical protein A2Y82_01955 [Candidatus Buchananbacteria bacterium RBG_13_36_9]|uniref:DNA methylase N-4/N-6 domain-containing protein n=1 Tax=Candidatus Buchananbacteria bacterium RBG_13_36_9 TaxID=1797530 RepID=A0A1G1XME5_9BACT|nr:MAG: hypothetical protein A2Y82_01955 [Candidatus Buchananbacteria bacterium RBG_13_36_9]
MVKLNKSKYEKYTREELIDELETLKKKKYGLVWDKKNSQEMLDAFVNWENVPENFVPKQFPVLKKVKNKEIETDKAKSVNLLIEGDNYHSLAVLNFTHQNKIDVIYIDPPYNTGNNDFIYNDKFIDKEDPFRHSKWLSFMEKRLKLARSLLKKDGLIFISIDDNEQSQLKLLCDEIFEEKNFIAQIVWRKKYGGGKGTRFFVDLHEYILIYAKDISQIDQFLLERSADQTQIFKERDEYFKERGAFYIRPLKSGLALRKTLIYPIKCPDGSEVETQWICGRETYEQLLSEGRIVFKKLKNGKYNIYKKFYEKDGEGLVHPESIFYDLAYNQNGKEELKKIFNIQEGRDIPFENPKPTKLIQYLLQIARRKDATILDYMAGSGTTGHAVLKLNNEDGGSRKFILCTNDEEIDHNGNSKKHKICTDVCYPRIEKVINGYKNKKGEKISGLGGNLKYFKTDFVGSDSTDKNKRDLVNKSAEMICIKEDIFDLVVDGGLDYRIYQKGKKFLGVIFDIDAIADFKKEAEKHKGNFVVYCFSYTEVTPEKEFKGLKNKYVLKPIPAVILRIYLEIFKK